MKKIQSTIFKMMRQTKEGIIEAMQKRGVTKVNLIMTQEEFAKEKGFDDAEKAEEDYSDYKINEAPYVIVFDKWGMGHDYQALSVELVEGISLEDGSETWRFKLNCYASEEGNDWFYDSDLTYTSMIGVYDCMIEALGLENEEDDDDDDDPNCPDPADGVGEDDPAQEVYAEYSKDVRKAVAYVNSQLEPEDRAIICARVSKNFKQHMNPAYGIDEGKIIDLLEEYGDDHDLPEGWWESETDMDSIVLLIQFEN